jgi:hypothetical protein
MKTGITLLLAAALIAGCTQAPLTAREERIYAAVAECNERTGARAEVLQILPSGHFSWRTSAPSGLDSVRVRQCLRDYHGFRFGGDPGYRAPTSADPASTPAPSAKAPPERPSAPKAASATVPKPSAPPTPSTSTPAVSTVPVQVVERMVLVSVTLGGRHGATLLLDTGAQYTVVTPALAQRLGVAPPTGAPRRSISLIGGQKIEMPFVRLPAIQIGAVTVSDVEAGVHAVAPEAPMVDGLLGADVLSRFRITVDHEARQLRLESR